MAGEVTEIESGRTVRLGERLLRLPWRAPAIGSRHEAEFHIPPARRTNAPLTFLAVEIPFDQMRPPWVAEFLDAVHSALHVARAPE